MMGRGLTKPTVMATKIVESGAAELLPKWGSGGFASDRQPPLGEMVEMRGAAELLIT